MQKTVKYTDYLAITLLTLVACVWLFLTPSFAQGNSPTNPNQVKTGYAKVNGLNMYYEVRGNGQPIVVLHGAAMSTAGMEAFTSSLAKSRKVIAVDLQGHGRTADIDRPLSYESMADSVIALLRQLSIPTTDVFGYSMGAGVAFQVAVRQPKLVRKLVLVSVYTDPKGYYPEVTESLKQLTPEDLAGTPFAQEYLKVAPRPQDLAKLMNKIKTLDLGFAGWSAEAVRRVKAPTLLVIGDADIVRPEHTVELFRWLGGGVPGDLVELPKTQLAVMPGTTHFTVLERTQWLMPMITKFLDASK